jgi:hypothetical protein
MFVSEQHAHLLQWFTLYLWKPGTPVREYTTLRSYRSQDLPKVHYHNVDNTRINRHEVELLTDSVYSHRSGHARDPAGKVKRRNTKSNALSSQAVRGYLGHVYTHTVCYVYVSCNQVRALEARTHGARNSIRRCQKIRRTLQLLAQQCCPCQNTQRSTYTGK